MIDRQRSAVDQAITDLNAGLPAEGVLLRILQAVKAEDRPAQPGQKEDV